jgi:hypothetical protein
MKRKGSSIAANAQATAAISSSSLFQNSKRMKNRDIVPGLVRLVVANDHTVLELCDESKDYVLKGKPFWENLSEEVDWNYIKARLESLKFSSYKTIEEWSRNKIYPGNFYIDAKKCRSAAERCGALRDFHLDYTDRFNPVKRQVTHPSEFTVSNEFVQFFRDKSVEEHTRENYLKRMRMLASHLEMLGHFDFEELADTTHAKRELESFLSTKQLASSLNFVVTQAVIVLLVIKTIRQYVPRNLQEKISVFNMFLKQWTWDEDGQIKSKEEARALISKILKLSHDRVKTFIIAGGNMYTFLSHYDKHKLRTAFEGLPEVVSALLMTAPGRMKMEMEILTKVAEMNGATIEVVREKIQARGMNRVFNELVKKAMLRPARHAQASKAVVRELTLRLFKENDEWKNIVAGLVKSSKNGQARFDVFSRIKSLLPVEMEAYERNEYAGTLAELIELLRFSYSLKMKGMQDKFVELLRIIEQCLKLYTFEWGRLSQKVVEEFNKGRPGWRRLVFEKKFAYSMLPPAYDKELFTVSSSRSLEIATATATVAAGAEEEEENEY